MFFEILGYGVGVVIGLLLGMIGCGGALLLPAMLYLFHYDVTLGSAYATILVGATALIGLIPRWKSNYIDWSTVLVLGVPVSVGMWLVRAWLLEAIPDELFRIGHFVVTKKMFVLGIFAMLLVLSFASMLGLIGKRSQLPADFKKTNPVRYYTLIGLLGLAIGIFPGFAGAGGGVLLVPLLVILFNVPIKTVVGTSLAIVFSKSVVGFLGGDVLRLGHQIDWLFLLRFFAVMLLGVMVGSFLSHKFDERHLRIGFAWFALALALFIVVKEFFLV